MADQNFKVYLSFKDEATGKFVEATNQQIAAIKKLGIAVGTEASKTALNLDKMAQGSEKNKRAFRFLGGEITGVMKSLGSLRNMILVYLFALRPLFELVKQSTEAYIKQEDALARLNYALGLQGVASSIVSNQLLTLSKRFQEITRYSDETALQIMDTLMSVGRIMPNELAKVTGAVLDFATKTRRDPVDAALLFAKASQGITTGLRRAGIMIDEATPKSRVLAEVLRYVNQQMGGAAQADIATYGGRLTQLANSIDEVKESIGMLIAKGLNLPTVANWWKTFFDNINKAITGESITVLGTLEKKLADINKQIAAGAGEIAKQKAQPLWFITGGYSAAEIAKAKMIVGEREATIRAIAFEKQVQANQEMLAEQRIAEEKNKQLKLQAEEDFLMQYNALAGRRIEVEKKVLEEDYERFKQNVDDKVAVERWHSERVAEIMKQSARLTYDAGNTLMTAYATGMRDALSDGFIKVVKGDFQGLKDVIVNFGDIMLKTISEIIANLIIMTIWKNAAGFLGFPGGFSFGPTGLAGHTGGYVLSTANSFGYAKKFHSGGEVPAMLLEGEGVLNRRGMASLGVDNLNKLNRGEQAGGGSVVNNYYIQTIDERSFRERLQEHGDVYASAAETGIKDNTSLRKTTQRWGG